MSPVSQSRLLIFLLSLSLSGLLSGAVRSKPKQKASTRKAVSAKATGTRSRTVSAKSTKRVVSKGKTGSKSRVASRRSKRRYRPGNSNYVAGGPWLEPTFADSTLGDNVDGEDLTVRRAAVDALGAYNGTVVVADPQTGRLLTVVNQKVAFKQGFQPCSTIKIVAAVAGLHEGVIDRATNMRLYGRTSMNLTDALARSNNPYFANIGVKL